MPYRDGTGPAGFGSMTGRKAGFYAGFNAPGYANSSFFGGFGGRGRRIKQGSGFRNRFFASLYPVPALSTKQELEMLKNQSVLLQEEMNAINGRIKDLECDKPEQ